MLRSLRIVIATSLGCLSVVGTIATPPAAEISDGDVAGPPVTVVLGRQEARGVLGREVRSAADENMGRIIDVIVDKTGNARAVVIDFGGFLGVGSRKIAVDWNALQFGTAGDNDRVSVQFSRDQVKASPEYRDGKPIFVLSATGALDRVSVTTSIN